MHIKRIYIRNLSVWVRLPPWACIWSWRTNCGFEWADCWRIPTTRDKFDCPAALNCETMGNADTKIAFRKAVVQLTTKKTVSSDCHWLLKSLFGTCCRCCYFWLCSTSYDLRYRHWKPVTMHFGINFGLIPVSLLVIYLRLSQRGKSGPCETKIHQIWQRYVTRYKRLKNATLL